MEQRPPGPTLRANPFPKVTDLFCQLPLPTLSYWLEATYLGDLMRLWVRPGVQVNHLISFSRAIGSAPKQFKSNCLSQWMNLISSWAVSRAHSSVRKKRKLSLGHPLAVLILLVLPLSTHILVQEYWPDSLSLLHVTQRWQIFWHFSLHLGLTNPCPIAVHMEPFSTSVFKVLIWIFATTTKICTKSHFTLAYTMSCTTALTPSYALQMYTCCNGCM